MSLLFTINVRRSASVLRKKHKEYKMLVQGSYGFRLLFKKISIDEVKKYKRNIVTDEGTIRVADARMINFYYLQSKSSEM